MTQYSYRLRPTPPVQARQVRPGTAESVADWCNGRWFSVERFLEVRAGNGQMVEAWEGDWIILTDATRSVLSDKEFKIRYERVR